MPTKQLFGQAATFLLAATAAVAPAGAQERDFSAVEIAVIPVGGGVSMLTGAGGNMAVSVGDDGVVLVDDPFAPPTDRIRAAVATLSPRPIRFLLNTHWHGDHTGGNENLAKAATLIVAHDNVRVRLASDQVMADLLTDRDMLVGVRAAVAKLIAEGRSVDEVVAARRTAPWSELVGDGDPERFLRILYDDLKHES